MVRWVRLPQHLAQVIFYSLFKCQNNPILNNSVQHLHTVQFCLTHRQDPVRAITSGHSRPEGDEWVLCIPQRSSITWASLPDCLMSYPGDSLAVGLTRLQRYSRCILLLQPTGLPDIGFIIKNKQLVILRILLFQPTTE